HAVLTRDEADAGQCPVCKATMSGAAITAVPPRHEAISDTPRTSLRRCYFCGESGQCESLYCRVGYVNYWVFFYTKYVLRIRCPVCAECRSRFRMIVWMRILIVFLMFAVPMAVYLGIYMPFIAASKNPDLQRGTPGAMAVGFGTLCFPWLLCVPLG